MKLAATVMITLCLRLQADDGVKATSQVQAERLTKIEVMAWQGLQAKQDALNQEMREYFIETCKAHNIGLDVCQPNVKDMTISRSEPPKPASNKDTNPTEPKQAKNTAK